MNFIFKSLIKKQLKGVPEEQADMIIAAFEKNPELFQKIAAQVKSKTAAGMSEQDAAMEAMKEHGDELKQVLGK